MVSWLHGGLQLFGSLLVQSNHIVFRQFSITFVTFMAEGTQEPTTCTTEHLCRTTASIYTWVTTHLTVADHLGHVPSYLYFKSKMEVLRENTGPSYWDAGASFTGGTFERLLGTTFLYLMVETLLTEGVQTW